MLFLQLKGLFKKYSGKKTENADAHGRTLSTCLYSNVSSTTIILAFFEQQLLLKKITVKMNVLFVTNREKDI